VRPATPAIAVVLAAALVVRAAGAEEPRPDPLAIPLFVIEAGAPLAATEVTAVEAGIGAPLLRGDDLRRRLSLAGAGDPVDEAGLAGRASRAADRFFAGDHETARAEFEGLLGIIEGRPEHLARDPGLRSVAFDTRMFLAVIARQNGQEPRIDELLAEARRRYPELEPGTADFPPWLRERHESVVAQGPEKEGALTLEAPAGCELVVDGRLATTAGDRLVLLERGAHALRTRCQGRLGPIVVLRDGAAPAGFRPPSLPAVRLTADAGELVLAAEAGAGEEDLVRDLLELARAYDFQRIAAVVGRREGIELWLVDADLDGLARKVRVEPAADAGAFARAGAELAGAGTADDDGRRPWYRDGTAWALTAVGLVAAGTGLILGRVYGGPSEQEPAAWALMASGAALTATGVVLFLVPAPDGAGDGVAVTAGAAWSF